MNHDKEAYEQLIQSSRRANAQATRLSNHKPMLPEHVNPYRAIPKGEIARLNPKIVTQ